MAKISYKAKKGGNYKLPPEGTYDYEIVGYEMEDPDDGGNPRLFLNLKIADGDQAGAEVRDYHTLNEKMGWKMRNVLQNTGVDYEESDGGEGEPYAIEFDPDDLIGRYFRADLTHYKNPNTKKTYPNFGEHQVSPLQEAAQADSGEAPAAEEAPPAEEPASAKASTAPATPAKQNASANAGTSRPRPRPQVR
jgi:hypothetical protein